MYNYGNGTSMQGSGPAGNIGYGHGEQPKSRSRTKHGANKGYLEDLQDGPMEISDGRGVSGGKSMFVGYQTGSKEDKTSSSDYSTIRAPQIGGRNGGGAVNNPSLLQTQVNVNPIMNSNGPTASNILSPRNGNRDVASSNRRNRSASRQSGSRARRNRQSSDSVLTGGGEGGGKPANPFSNGGQSTTDGPTLPQIGSNGVQSVSPSAGPSIFASAGQGGSRRIIQQPQQQQNPSGTTGVLPQAMGLGVTSEEHTTASVVSIKGLKPGNPNWTNQDNFFVTERFDSKDVNIYCVLDGHGENGHHVSKRAREMFGLHIKAANLDMRRAFTMMHTDLMAQEFDVRCSGATCCLAVISGGRLAVSNCGDSRAVLGRRNPNGSMTAHALTYDHKPDKPEERRRILSCGGHLGCRQVIVNQPGKGPVSVPVGPCRVWYQHNGETLGLAMSRSLGDSVVHRCGVSAEPETLEHMLDDYDEFMIIATDGVWDVIDNSQAVQIVASFSSKSSQWSALEASASVTKFARGRWEKLSPMIDDITCIVVKLRR